MLPAFVLVAAPVTTVYPAVFWGTRLMAFFMAALIGLTLQLPLQKRGSGAVSLFSAFCSATCAFDFHSSLFKLFCFLQALC
jgi:hypothetical protein